MIQKRLTDDALLKADYVKFRTFIDGGKQFVPFIKAIVDDLPDALDDNLMALIRDFLKFFMWVWVRSGQRNLASRNIQEI
jgi:hypothetical protein